MIGKLLVWRQLYLTPVAPLYLLCAIGGTAFLLIAFYAELPRIGLAGLCMAGIPFIVSLVAALFIRRNDHAEYFGLIHSYRLTDRELTYMLGRVVPVFRVSLAEVQGVQPWRGVAPAAAGSNEARSWWFLSSQVWFWPVPISYMAKKLTSAQALKCEYILSCDSGWIIVIACSYDFINRVANNSRKVRREATAAPNRTT